jgi:hypothetical protein
VCPPQDWTVLNRAQGLWHVAMRTQWWPHIQPRLELTSISIAWFCTHPLLCAPPPTANLVVTLTSCMSARPSRRLCSGLISSSHQSCHVLEGTLFTGEGHEAHVLQDGRGFSGALFGY